ncbi:MAG: potassium/proton antiporter [Gammaproteobacteria bacterium]|nr:potassium/proton antiporter [Gammaproteobacteria bacterium]
MDLAQHLLLVIGALVLASILAAAFTPRLGAPLLLVFLAVGMLAGTEGPGGIVFSSYPLANLAGIAALAVILFDGGLRTELEDFRTGLGPGLSLATVGVLVTAAVTGACAAWLLHLPWIEGFLVGAIVSSTDAAAVFSLLGGASGGFNQRVSSVLEIESGTNDPMAVVLTLGILLYLADPQGFGWWQGLLFLVSQIGIGALIGVAGGLALGYAIEHLELGGALYPLLALFGALVLFGLTGTLSGSGFLAVYLAGLVLGNRGTRQLAAIRRFLDVIAWLAQIGLFLLLGLLVVPSRLLQLAVPALAVALVLILLARPLAVWLAMAPFGFKRNERGFIAWVGLRGSVPIVLATYPWLAGINHAELIFDAVFFIVLVSLVLQGWTVSLAARMTALDVPAPAALVHRVDFDLPGSRGYEIVSYRLASGSPLVGRPVRRIPIKDLSRIVCMVRGGRVLRGDEWDDLRAGDRVSLLATRDELTELDRLFRAASKAHPQRLRAFFGDFVIAADVPVAELARAYGAQLPPHADAQTVAEFAASYLPRPVVGDRLRLGPVELVIREMDGGRPTALGLRFPDDETDGQRTGGTPPAGGAAAQAER